MMPRPELVERVNAGLKHSPVTLILSLELERLWVVYPGKTGYPMDEKIECVSLAALGRVREMLR